MNDAAHRSETSPMRREFLLILILAGVQFSHIIDFVIMMPLGPQLMRVFGISPRDFALVVSVYTLSASLSCFGASLYMDRFDRKKVLLTTYAGLVVGTLLCGLAPSFSALVMARAVTGVFGGLLQPVILAIIGDLVPAGRRGQATGIVMAAFAVSSVVGVPVGLTVANSFGWQATFQTVAAFSCVNLFLAIRVLPQVRAHLTQERSRVGLFAGMMDLLRRRNSWVAIVLITMMMSIFAFTPFVSPFLVSIVGISEADLPTVYMFAGVVSFIVSPAIGKLADRFGARRIFISSSVIAVPAMLIFSQLQRTSLGVAVAWNTLVAAVGAARMTPSLTLINSSVTSDKRGRFMTLIASVQQLSAAVASYCGGVLLGDSAAGLQKFSILGGIVAGSMVVSSMLSLLIRPEQ